MKKILFFLISFLAISGLAFGSPLPDLVIEDHIDSHESIYKIPSKPELPSHAIADQHPVEASKKQRYIPTRPELDAIKDISGAHYYTILKDWDFSPSQVEQLYNQFEAQPDMSVENLAITTSTIFGPYNMVNDNAQDAEPAVMATNRYGVTYLMSSYIKIVNGTTPRNMSMILRHPSSVFSVLFPHYRVSVSAC